MMIILLLFISRRSGYTSKAPEKPEISRADDFAAEQSGQEQNQPREFPGFYSISSINAKNAPILKRKRGVF